LDLVFNEWFVEYMVPESSKSQLIWGLLDAFESKSDRLVVRRKSPFMQKFYRFSKLYGRVGQRSRDVFRRFFLLLPSDKIWLVDEDEIQPLANAVLDVVNDDDIYLVELAKLTQERTIVTTDRRLRDALDGKEDFRVILLDDFIAEYAPSVGLG